MDLSHNKAFAAASKHNSMKSTTAHSFNSTKEYAGGLMALQTKKREEKRHPGNNDKHLLYNKKKEMKLSRIWTEFLS